jgi:hypothetical protein
VNRPPPPGSPWDQRRPDPDPDDPTRVARPWPPPANRTPSPPASWPPTVNPPRRPPEIPWYLQRPDRSAPAAPHVERQQPAAAVQASASTHFERYLPWLLLGAGGAALLIGAVVLIANVAHLGITGGTELDVTKVQNGVVQTLSDPASGYGANTVTDVSCNGGRNPSARQGTTFTCNATVNGAARHITVLVSDDRGTYEIDSPR